MIQIIINIIISFSIYLLVAQSFVVIYYPARFFHIGHAVIITISAYFFYMFFNQFGLPVWLSVLFSVILAILLSVLFELFIFLKLRKRKVNSLKLMIASIGLYIVFQNLISIIWGDDIKSLRTSNVVVGNEVFGAYITNVQILTIVICLLLFLGSIILIKYSRLGKIFRGISSNMGLSNIYGINSNKTILVLFILSSFFASVIGILIGYDNDITPNMGFNILLYGVVTMIIGGVGSTWGLIGGALLLASAQHLGAYYIDSKWMDAIAYLILILFLIWNPLGFSGNLLKKVEV